jgi:YD repeat-containing protein
MIRAGQPSSPNAGWVYTSLSNGDGYPFWAWNSAQEKISDAGRVGYGDVNGDGRADLIAVGPAEAANAGSVYISLSTKVEVPNYVYDSRGRLVYIISTQSFQFQYDPNGNLVRKAKVK